MFLDASAMVAIASHETDGQRTANALDEDDTFVTSPLAIWEAVVALLKKSRQRGLSPTIVVARATLDRTFAPIPLTIEPLTDADAKNALDAFSKYGRGSTSKAKLNMGDCFHYAVAKRLGASILFTSPDEFHYTDLACAVARP